MYSIMLQFSLHYKHKFILILKNFKSCPLCCMYVSFIDSNWCKNSVTCSTSFAPCVPAGLRGSLLGKHSNGWICWDMGMNVQLHQVLPNSATSDSCWQCLWLCFPPHCHYCVFWLSNFRGNWVERIISLLICVSLLERLVSPILVSHLGFLFSELPVDALCSALYFLVSCICCCWFAEIPYSFKTNTLLFWRSAIKDFSRSAMHGWSRHSAPSRAEIFDFDAVEATVIRTKLRGGVRLSG